MQYFAYSQKAFVYKYIVMMSDIDQFKHMSFANYLKLMFLATDALLISCFNDAFLNANRLVLIDSRMQFKRQTIFGDNILIKINSSEMENAKFSLLYTYVIEETGELVALGRQTYSVYVQNNEMTKELPHEFSSVLRPIFVDEQHLLYKY